MYYVHDSLIFLVESGNFDGLEIVNAGDPESPFIIGSYDTYPHGGYGVYVKDSLAYLAAGYRGLIVLDITDPISPAFVGAYDTTGSPRDVLVMDTLAYVADYSEGVKIVNVADPTAPALVGSYVTPAFLSENLYVKDSIIYVADTYSLILLKIALESSTAVHDEIGNRQFSDGFSTAQNYPNPFNPATTIEYNVPARSHVTLSIYNLLGQKVIDLVDEEKPAGRYSVSWGGRTYNGNKTASGIYLYQLRAGEFEDTRKMILLR